MMVDELAGLMVDDLVDEMAGLMAVYLEMMMAH